MLGWPAGPKASPPRQVDRLGPLLQERARALVDQVAPLGECDFSQDLAADLPLLALAEVLGIPAADRRLLYDWGNRIIGFQDPEYARFDEEGRPIDPRSRAALVDMFDYAHHLADRRRWEPGDDVITALLHA